MFLGGFLNPPKKTNVFELGENVDISSNNEDLNKEIRKTPVCSSKKGNR